jgi:hypothetical protein
LEEEMKTKFVTALILLWIVGGQKCWGISPDELPIAIQGVEVTLPITGETLDSMRQSLGFNIYYAFSVSGNISETKRNFIRSHGFALITAITDSGNVQLNNAYQDYYDAHHLIVEAEERNSGIRFDKYAANCYDSSGWWVAPVPVDSAPYIALDNLWFKHEARCLDDYISYIPHLRLRMDPGPPLPDSAVPVAYLNVFSASGDCGDSCTWTDDVGWGWLHGDTLRSYSISYGQLVMGDTVTLPFQFFEVADFKWVTYQVVTAGIRPIAVDWFKVSNDEGEYVMSGQYDSVFAAFIQQDTTALCYHLRDDMMMDQMTIARHVDNIIQANSNENGMMKWNENFLRCPGSSHSESTFTRIAQPKHFWLDPYPFLGGDEWGGVCDDGTFTRYTSYALSGDWGLQWALTNLVTRRLGNLRSVVGDSIEIWYNAQCQTAQHSGCLTLMNRRPTPAEMSAEAMIALCYGVRGIQFWPYETYTSGVSANTYSGFVLANGEHTPAWGYLRDRVIPYLKAIDSVYMGLEWQRAYPYHLGSPSFLPPASAFVDSIFAISNTTDPNPDLGWFHVGEYRKAFGAGDEQQAYDRYLMLVNRACSQGEYDSAEAPPITATVRFNPSNLGLGDYVYVIDITTGTDSADWVGVPETTYTAKMPDGTIPFTTVFRAGEGRLFKIVAAPENTKLTR